MRKSLGISLALLVIIVLSTQAFAERRRRGQQTSNATPHSDQIVSAMEDIDWGWGNKKLIRHFTKNLRELYRPLLAKAHDAITEDRLRKQMNARINRIRKSYVEFNGQRTGWDTSLIRDEYTHNNNESLVEVRELRAGNQDPRYTDYFFFINNKLWRRYRAFNQDQFQGIPFEAAAASFQKRFGAAKELRNSGGKLLGLEWQDNSTKLQALDNTEFYGVFCLVFTDKSTERRLSQLRKNKQAKKSGLSPLLQMLESDTSVHDANENVVEHITGKRYKTAQKQGAAKGRDGSSGSKSRKSGKSSSSQSSSPRKRSIDELEL